MILKHLTKIILFLVFLIAAVTFYFYNQSFLVSESQFDRDVGPISILVLNETFDSYAPYSESIDQMEKTQGYSFSGPRVSRLIKSEDNYGGEKSVEFTLYPSEKNVLIMQKVLDSSIDLSRWKSKGAISFWLRVEKPEDISRISLKITDSSGNQAQFEGRENLLFSDSNEIKQDDQYPDYYLPKEDGSLNKWEDFMLVEGWNYLFWAVNEEDLEDLDFSKISRYEIEIKLREGYSKQKINLDNLRIQDGLQRKENPTGGAWYSPNGVPMYGVFDIDKISQDDNDYKIRLLNVRQPQYPSNGDHVRILSKASTPKDFALRTRFEFVNIKKENSFKKFIRRTTRGGGVLTEKIDEALGSDKSLQNTWFRLQYDFDNEYDPGHDWFGLFISMEYKKFGLVSTVPIERYFKQDQEPKNFSEETRIPFEVEEGKMYEIDLTVRGQHAVATIYEVKGEKLKELGNVEYTFERERYGLDKRYPFSIEVTGNTHLEVYLFEVVEI